MEYGLISKLDQFTDNRLAQVQQVQSVNSTSKIDQDTKLKEVQTDKFLNNEAVSSTQKTTNEGTTQQYEVVLTNTNFGFNDSSKDFFVKAIRGSTENQYPTEDMMRLKSYLLGLE